MIDNRDNYLTSKEAAKKTGLCIDTIWEWARKKKIKSVKDENGCSYLFKKEDIEKFIKDRKRNREHGYYFTIRFPIEIQNKINEQRKAEKKTLTGVIRDIISLYYEEKL